MTDQTPPSPASSCRVSVIIPTFNRADVLRENIDSVTAQDFQDYEIIYVDDGSTDATPEILAEAQAAHRDRLRHIRTENSGPGRARNAGVGEAHGEFLLFTDDDATVPANWISAMLEAHQASGHPILCGGIDPYAMDSPIERYLHYRMQTALGKRPRPLSAAPTGNLLIPKAVFEGVGGFRDEAFPAAEDWDLSYRLRAGGQTLYYDPSVAVSHRYQCEWAAAAQRMRTTGAMGLHIARHHYRSPAAYTAYSLLRFLLSPLWIPRHYPARLYLLAWRMEAIFALARLKAYLQS